MFKRLRSQFLRILPTIIILSSFVHGAYDPNDPRHQLVNKIKEQYATEISARQALLGTHYNVVALVDIARERLELERFTPSDPDWSLVIRCALSGYGYSKGVDTTLRTSDAEISSLKVGHALSSAYIRAQGGVEPVEISQMHGAIATAAVASLVDVTTTVTDAVPVPSTLLSSLEEHADILNRVAASIPEEVHAFAETASDRLRGLKHLNKFNAWFAHERFWAAGGVIDPHTYEQQRTSRAAFAGTPIAFLNDLITKLDTAMRSMDAVPTPQSVEDLVRQSQQILLTIAAGTIGEDGIPIRLNPANAADWQLIRKALFLALSVTEDPEKSGRGFLAPVYDLANYYHQKTDADAIKEYYLRLEAYGVGFSTIWKGLKETQTNATIQTILAEKREMYSDQLYWFIRKSPASTVQRNTFDPIYKGAFVSSINAISVVDSRAELATALGLHGRLNHTQVFKTLYPDLTMWAEDHVPRARAEELMGSARPRIVVPADFQPKRIHLAYVAGKWSLKGINGAREHILWTQGASATAEFIGSLEDGRGTHLFNFKVEGATAVIKTISSGYGFNAENDGTNVVVADGDELGLIESSAYPEDTDVENFADGSIIIRGNTYSGMRGFLSALRSSALITAPKIDLNYAKGFEVRTHSNGATFKFLVKKGQGIDAHNSVMLNGDNVALNQSSIRGRFTVQMYRQTGSNNYLRTDGTDIQTAYFFLEHN